VWIAIEGIVHRFSVIRARGDCIVSNVTPRIRYPCSVDDPRPPRAAIAEVSELLGVPVPTIRSWERRYGFPSPARTSGKHRRYTLGEVDSLRAVRDEITRGHRARDAVAIVRSRVGAPSGRSEFLERFTEGATALDADDVRRSLDQAAELLGVDRAINEVALPGMRELGDRWKAGRCDAANEHLATQIVRQWFARLAALAPPPYRRRPLVLACGPTELHTIGLEAFAVVLARRGWSCRVLGAMTPVDALVSAVRTSRAAGAIVSAQRSVGRRGAVEALRAVSAIPGVNALYGGNAFATARAREDVPGRYLGTDLEEAADLVESGVH
jgi:MerR family transcriptional regulator, light-induced transcriptional regulator